MYLSGTLLTVTHLAANIVLDTCLKLLSGMTLSARTYKKLEKGLKHQDTIIWRILFKLAACGVCQKLAVLQLTILQLASSKFMVWVAYSVQL